LSEETGKSSRSAAVTALAKLPLYQLSTAGMELFHTNMLYWLATERPGQSFAVWQTLGLPDGLQPPQGVRREWLHIDLAAWSETDERALVLENKIGAIPNPGQLDGYYAKLRSTQLPFSLLDSTAFVLLTLTPPSFTLPKPWSSVTYRDLLSPFRETAQQLTGTDAALLSAYEEMVARLDDVATAFDPAHDLDTPFALTFNEWSLVNGSRLMPLVERVRTGRFAELAIRELTTALGEVGQVGAGFSNGSGIYEWFIPGPAGRRIGWQIQGGAFRLAVIGGTRDPHVKAGLEALVAELYESYFDFTPPEHLSHTLSRYRGKKQWLGYKPSFVYRYAELTPATTWRELLELVAWFSRRALEVVSVG
jgi:hypothetical protein